MLLIVIRLSFALVIRKHFSPPLVNNIAILKLTEPLVLVLTID